MIYFKGKLFREGFIGQEVRLRFNGTLVVQKDGSLAPLKVYGKSTQIVSTVYYKTRKLFSSIFTNFNDLDISTYFTTAKKVFLPDYFDVQVRLKNIKKIAKTWYKRAENIYDNKTIVERWSVDGIIPYSIIRGLADPKDLVTIEGFPLLIDLSLFSRALWNGEINTTKIILGDKKVSLNYLYHLSPTMLLLRYKSIQWCSVYDLNKVSSDMIFPALNIPVLRKELLKKEIIKIKEETKEVYEIEEDVFVPFCH